MPLNITLPDGNTLELANDATTHDVATMISQGLARKAVAGKVTRNDQTEIVDLSAPLKTDCHLTILTQGDDNADSLYLLRHSAAHVMAEAICQVFPETKLVYGPPLEDGFYYDIDLQKSLTPEDFPAIEQEMLKIIKEDRRFSRYDLPREEAMAKLSDEGSRYKIDNAKRAEGDSLSFYITGETRGKNFEDLCRGPHIPRTGLIKAFKIKQVSRSHYRGDINDQPLQRVYGTAFYKKSSLEAHFKQLEEAKKRDHRVIGKELNLFTISDKVGTGLVLWQPKGTIIRNELQKYLTEEMVKLGYELVITPHIGQLDLWRTSGHFPYYEDSQYPAMMETDRGKSIQAALQLARRVKNYQGDELKRGRESTALYVRTIQDIWGKIEGLTADAPLDKIIDRLYTAMVEEPGYLLKPMNCPHHIQIYASRPRSYRDLPVRMAEYGTVYRYEQSGECSGITRVRGFTQDDAHLFCTHEQLQDELVTTVKLTIQVLEVLGLKEYRVRVGFRDDVSDKFVGSKENWEKAQQAVIAAVEESGVEYTVEIGEAAFYGPKIDFVVKDCIGRSWQLGTVQADYNAPERFDLTYIGQDNKPHRPVMIHRAPFGSLERFVGILIEHFAGAFPLWLAPVQVGLASVSEKSVAYAQQVMGRLLEADLRVELDTGDEKIGPKKHRFRKEKINYILVVGEQEAGQETVNVNDRNGRSLGNLKLGEFIEMCHQEIESKQYSVMTSSS